MRVLHRLLHNYSCSPLLHRQIATAYPVTVLCQLLWPWLSLLPPPAYHLSPHEAFNVAHPNLYKPPNIRTQIRSWYLSGSIACSPTALLGQYHSSSSPPPTHCVGLKPSCILLSVPTLYTHRVMVETQRLLSLLHHLLPSLHLLCCLESWVMVQSRMVRSLHLLPCHHPSCLYTLPSNLLPK